MSVSPKVDEGLVDQINAIGNGHPLLFAAERLQKEFVSSGALLLYHLDPQHVLRVGIQGVNLQGMQIYEDHHITTRLAEPSTALLEVCDDTATYDNWTGWTINLGYTSEATDRIGTTSWDLQSGKGILMPHAWVTVDLTGNHFRNEDAISCMAAKYIFAAIDDIVIFD